MSPTHDFHYRVGARVGGFRPGAHAGLAFGAGDDFVTHATLFARPDPRRIDLRASLRDPRGEWLVRLARQRSHIPVFALIDVSASMGFGTPTRKLDLAADFVAALGRAATAAGDPLSLSAFDDAERPELRLAPSRQPALVAQYAEQLRTAECRSAGHGGLIDALAPLAGRQAQVFLVSDFHRHDAELDTALDLLGRARVTPIVIWSPSETEPPAGDGLLRLRDLENGRLRELWLRPELRRRWRSAVAERRRALDLRFQARGIRAFYMSDPFVGDALTRHFLEGA
ncbi:MAG: MxaS protein [Zoogloeaceae bacterium]|nr:MxaS protein [Zoogloeaceae bacterium]